MHVPALFGISDPAEVLQLLRSTAFGHLVTTAGGTVDATPLPFLVDDDINVVRCHLARANPQWHRVDGTDALFVVPVADAYVSPRWYPTKGDTGEVVPTWNYLTVHLRGTVAVRHDRPWLDALVRELADVHERRTRGGDPWSVDDAPPAFIERMLAAVVGIELQVADVAAKGKLSQNRPEPDRQAVAEALAASPTPGGRAVAAAMGALGAPGDEGVEPTVEPPGDGLTPST